MRKIHFSALLVALGCSAAACGGAPDGSSTSSGNAPQGALTPADTGVDGEHFTSLQGSDDALTGVFVKDDTSLAFEVRKAAAGTTGSTLRLSTASGETLYSVTQGPNGSETRIGSYRAFLPTTKGAAPSTHPNFSPTGFESTGDLSKALDAIKSTPLAIVPYLSAALGRVGMTGVQTPLALPLHMTAMHLTDTLKLEMHPNVATITNRIIASNRAAATPADGVAPEIGASDGKHTEGLTLPPISCPAANKPPCRAGTVPGTGAFAGCCITPSQPAPVIDYTTTPYCHSGAGREYFGGLGGDPCNDGCFGMCGPGCSPWEWVCGDERVHTACWNHDRASCPTNSWSDYLNYPFCMATYGAYSAWIFTDTQALGMCANNWFVDAVTEPWTGTVNHPDYYVTY
jgi:hypothetical protein